VELRNPEHKQLTDVAVVDGLWMCCRRALWQHFPFDSYTFSEFHFYDIDFCTEIFRQGKRICVTYEVILEHHSRGSINASWARNALLYQKKRKGQLPFGVASLTKQQSDLLELKATQAFLGLLLRENFSGSVIRRYLAYSWFQDPWNRDTLWLIKQWLLRHFRK
jgi:GT2 family glycosyltransferase